MAPVAIVTVIACLTAAVVVMFLAQAISHSCYLKLVRVLYRDHHEEWLHEGKPEHLLLGGGLTGRSRGSENLFSKWLYSPPGWISASEPLRRLHDRMRYWDRISKGIFVTLLILALLVLNSLFLIFGRMNKREQGVAPNHSLPPPA